MGMKLGKLEPRNDPRTLRLASYLRPDLPQPMPVDWGSKVAVWPMMKNDAIGDCTCAAAGHLIQGWTANAATMIVPTDDQIVEAYSAITGYNPADERTDQGAVELDVLNYWRNTGIAGHQILAYAAIQPGNHEHIQLTLDIFGGVYIGVALPVSAEHQDVWEVVARDGAPGSWGGHAVPIIEYDDTHLTCVTWGATKKMSWDFWDRYCDEAYAIITQDFIEANGETPSAFNLQQLQDDLKALAA